MSESVAASLAVLDAHRARQAIELSTEDELALEFARRHPHWRYTADWSRWYYYDGNRAIWCHDGRLRHLTLIRELLRDVAPERLHRAAAVAGVASLARSNPGAAMSAESWDADIWLLGTPGAVIDLRTGEPVADPMSAHITMQTSCPAALPGTPAPMWERFLERVTRHDPDLVGYLQRIAGYGLSGSDREQCLFFAYGPGGNGKGVFMNTLTAIAGTYAHVASGDLLLSASGERHPTDMASLRGRRLVTASELRPGARWDEQRLKSLTGGDPITARFMRCDEFTFRPQFALLIAGNHRPSFSGVDEAIRRRLRLVPFSQSIPESERDPDLPEKLRAEHPAILRWMIDGCLAWQRDGLTTPASVRAASAQYLEAEDALGQWMADCLETFAPAMRIHTSRADLFASWERWIERNGGPSWSAKALYAAMEERGIEPGIREGVRGFRHVALRSGYGYGP